MAGSENDGPMAAPAWTAREPGRRGPGLVRLAGVVAGLIALVWAFPLFHVVALKRAAPVPDATGATAGFDPVAAATRIWATDLPAAAQRAHELQGMAGLLRENAGQARSQFAKAAGLGTAYYFVRGSGKVVARERNFLRIAVDGTAPEIVALRIGPIFGNTVRDGCGLLDVNAFPGLQEFNALSAELNGLVEKHVLPVLREQATVGATVQFAGCAEAPENAADAGEPLLVIVPIRAEVR